MMINQIFPTNGNRIMKPRHDGVLSNQDEWTYTFYTRDASGNIMSAYERSFTDNTTTWDDDYKLKEQHVYGSSRLGVRNTEKLLATETFESSGFDADGKFIRTNQSGFQPFNIDYVINNRTLGNKTYELANHLGSVVVTLSDRKIPTEDAQNPGYVGYFEAHVRSAQNMYPFGFVQPNENNLSSGYRFGFNGMEGDGELKGEGNSYDFGTRIYDPRLGRFLSLDSKHMQVPWASPYSFAENDVIRAIDIDGESKWIITLMIYEDGTIGASIAAGEGSQWTDEDVQLNVIDVANQELVLQRYFSSYNDFSQYAQYNISPPKNGEGEENTGVSTAENGAQEESLWDYLISHIPNLVIISESKLQEGFAPKFRSRGKTTQIEFETIKDLFSLYSKLLKGKKIGEPTLDPDNKAQDAIKKMMEQEVDAKFAKILKEKATKKVGNVGNTKPTIIREHQVELNPLNGSTIWSYQRTDTIPGENSNDTLKVVRRRNADHEKSKIQD